MAIYLGSLELATGAAAATGTGLPVNSYAPFFTSGSGNPTGYNATTGLYNHPNGDVWLDTGKTIVDSTSAYPSATSGGLLYSGTTFNLGACTTCIASGMEPHGLIWTGTSFWAGGFRTAPSPPYAQRNVQFDASGNFLSSFAVQGGGQAETIGWDGTDLYQPQSTSSSPVIYRLNESGVLQQTITITGIPAGLHGEIYAIVFVGTDVYISTTNNTNAQLYKLNSTFAYQSTITLPAALQPFATQFQITYDSNAIRLIAVAANNLYFYDIVAATWSAASPTGVTGDTGIAYVNGTVNILQGGANSGIGTISEMGPSVGNSIVQYSTANGAGTFPPMFVKLK
jgi:hypothetical protein